MDELFDDIIAHLHRQGSIDQRALNRLLTTHNRRVGGERRAFVKKHLFPYFLSVQENDPARWQRWHLSEADITTLTAALRMKPTRTQSGVATITVITKPWPCAGSCRYCPNDVRMPKSYLANEPACQRALRNYFDPYLQVASRLTALTLMGHALDKIELIVLGGTFSDYPVAYQTWFIRELFRALNDAGANLGTSSLTTGDAAGTHSAMHDDNVAARNATRSPSRLESEVALRRALYERNGLSADPATVTQRTATVQNSVDAGAITYNQAVQELYGNSPAWQTIAALQTATIEDMQLEQQRNEHALHRNVGLVIETRPDAITVESLRRLRRFGCTKIQMGIQGLDQNILLQNGRAITPARIAQAFALLRVFGFKSHAHFMVNLLGATPESDRSDYRRFVTEPSWMPDEIKLYPCALIAGTALEGDYRGGIWQPYDEDTLVDVLAQDVISTPAFTRISRMIRDFSSGDIMAGNKKTNLRQMVERRVADSRMPVREIRYREIGSEGCDISQLTLDDVPYETTNTSEHFLQWMTPAGKIAGFLRLSLPHRDFITSLGATSPVAPGEAMIREVHIYGNAARIEGDSISPAQHHGLGSHLIEEACRIARANGYERLNVISAVGTRAYYRQRGFVDNGLFLTRDLSDERAHHLI